jgi:3-oxoadipate enol-lactonase
MAEQRAEQRTARVNGVRLVYQVSGRPDRPPMVLLHALGERGADWAPVLDRLAENFRVITPDLRGHGGSDWTGSYTFSLMFEDISGLLDQLDLGPVTLIGHSMGAAVGS